MSTSNVSLPPLTYPLLILGMGAAPMILVAVLLLTTNGTVDLQNPRDVLGSAISGVLAAVVLIITSRAFYLTLVGKRVNTSPRLKAIALSAPIWWIIGTFGGVMVAKSIQAQVTETRWTLVQSYCAEAVGEEDTGAYGACLDIAHQCDKDADLGPCGKENLKTRQAAAHCTEKSLERLNELPAHERESLSGMESDHTKMWRATCILHGVRSFR